MTTALAFLIRGEGTETLEIDVYDVIGESWWNDSTVSAKKVREKLKGAGAKAKLIKLRINSRGGDVFDGFAIYNLLHEHPARVEADVDALAASMASVLLMAADEIRVASNAMVMIHNPWTIAMGEASDLRAGAELLDKIRDQIADAYVARTKLPRDRVLAMMDAETWLTASEAKALGFADVVKPAATGPEAARAMARLNLHGLRAPAPFASAVIAAARGDLPPVSSHRLSGGAQKELTEMTADELRALRARLGLPETASGTDVLQALDNHVHRSALDAHAARADAAEAQLRTMRAEQHAQAARTAIEAARRDGKIAPASVEHYQRMCATAEGLQAFQALVATLPTLVNSTPAPTPSPANGPAPTVGLTKRQRRLAAEMGLTEEAYAAALREAALIEAVDEDDED